MSLKQTLLSIVSLLFAGVLLAEPGRIRRVPERVPGRYIVVLKNVPPAQVAAVAGDLALRHAGRVGLIYSNAFMGFSVELSEQKAEQLSNDPRVLLVEEVALVHPSSAQPLPTDDRLWHLDRIDQREWIYQSAGDNTYMYCERARDVIAYVIDTGINRDHTEFLRGDGSSRVINGVKFATDHYVRPGETDDYGTLPCGGLDGQLPRGPRDFRGLRPRREHAGRG